MSATTTAVSRGERARAKRRASGGDAVTRLELAGGATVQVAESHEVPLVSITIAFRSGSASDPPGKEGAAKLAFRMLRRGSRTHTANDIEDELDRLGAELSTEVSVSSSAIHGQVIERNLGAFVDLARDPHRRARLPRARARPPPPRDDCRAHRGTRQRQEPRPGGVPEGGLPGPPLRAERDGLEQDAHRAHERGRARRVPDALRAGEPRLWHLRQVRKSCTQVNVWELDPAVAAVIQELNASQSWGRAQSNVGYIQGAARAIGVGTLESSDRAA